MKQLAMTLLKASITVGMIGFALSRIDTQSFHQQLARLSPSAALWVIAILTAHLLLGGARLMFLARQFGVPCRARLAVQVQLIGQFFSQVLLAFVAGDGMRIWKLTRSGCPASAASRMIVVDLMIGLTALVGLAALGLPMLFSLAPNLSLPLAISTLVLGGIAGILTLVLLQHLLGILPARLREHRLACWAAELSEDVARVCRSGHAISKPLLLAACQHLASVAAILTLARSLGMQLSWLHAATLIPPALLASLLPISIGGWGVREGALVVSLGLVGIPPDAALIMSVGYGLGFLVCGLPGGLLWAYTSSTVRRRGATGSPVYSRAPM